MKMLKRFIAILIFCLCLGLVNAAAQTNEFTYQGKLTDTGTPSPTYDFEFRLCALETDPCTGMVLLETKERLGVSVSNGIFTVKLDFLASHFTGADRFLLISVRRNNGEAWTPLTPRQKITSSPYSIKSLNADMATNATNATNSTNATNATTSQNALQLGGIAANGFIQNTTSPQSSNFNITGDGTAGGTLSGNIVNATQFNLNGTRILGDSPGLNNLFAGVAAGQANINGSQNAFFGRAAGFMNTDGNSNSFFGAGAGGNNFTGSNNTMIGFFANTGANNLTFATAIGSGASVSSSNTIALGRSNGSDTVQIPGNLNVSGAISGNGAGLTNLNGANIAPGSITSEQLSTDAVPNSNKLKLLGLLRWDLLKPNSFPVGSNPTGVAFDGTNIWVANYGSNNVTKLRASDGANLGTFTVGDNPVAIAFDGANIWTANENSNNVTKLRVSDGVNLGTFAVGTFPQGIAFDGANIWVSNNSSNNVTKLRTSDGANLGTFTVGSGPRGVVFDGANIWVANAGSGNITKLRASDGEPINTYTVNVFSFGIAFDGENIWVSSTGGITKLRASDGANLGVFGNGTSGIAFDGVNIWHTHQAPGGGRITKLRANDGVNLGTFNSGGNSPWGVAFDGTNIWVVNSSSNNITRLFPPFPTP